MLLGCIADDMTGATDLGLTLVRNGMNTVQTIGVPSQTYPEADAVVVALKSRTVPKEQAVAASLQAADRLLQAGAQQLFFKYCSTFDSTDDGNIGPVADALLERLDEEFTIACPAFPANGRTVFQGHLFVGHQLLSESSMKDHPLTPMRDANLVNVLQRQTHRRIGLIPIGVVDAGPNKVRMHISSLRKSGIQIAIVDAINDDHLRTAGVAAADLKLVTGGSGMAIGLPDNFCQRGTLGKRTSLPTMTAPAGRMAIFAGSCSTITLGQIEFARRAGLPAREISPVDIAKRPHSVGEVVAWALKQSADQPVLIYSSADLSSVAASQAELGQAAAADAVEGALSTIATILVKAGFRRLMVAGGETSGAIVEALGIKALSIGPEIDPGVPWTRSIGDPDLAIVLKSGNFGAPDFFLKAWVHIQ